MKSKPKILIVDDKVGNLVVLERILIGLDVEFVRAISGNEALAKTLEHEFAIILMDIQMPDMDGFETVKLMRMDSKNRNIPVIYISAVYSGDLNLILGLKSGAVDLIIKPIVPEILIGKVKIFLELHKNRIALQKAHDFLETRVKERTAELEKTNKLLKESEEKLSSFMDSATDGFILLDSQLNIVEINISAWKSFARKKQNVVGKNLVNFVPNLKESGRFYEYMDVMRSGKPFFIDDYFKHPRFGDKYTSIKAFKVGRGLGIITTDITKRKKAEEELEKYRDHLVELVEERTAELAASNRELESFSYSVSHDLRAPLRAIDGFSHKLLIKYSEALDEKGKHYLERVRAGCLRMGQLIDDLLQLSRVTRSDMKHEDVDLSIIANKIVTGLKEMNKERKVEFITGDKLLTKGDANLLFQVMENLLENAWKYTSKNDNAKIKFGTMEYKGKKAFFVRDNGVGFEMKYANKLFSAFQRLHSEVEFPGTGIGLATVKRIIFRHGGEVWAEGEVGKGATFYFVI